VGLENQSYCIDNKQYTKEEYLSKKADLLLQKSLFDSKYLSSKDFMQNKVFNNYCENVMNGFYNTGISV
jgi:hypothetical protein